MYKKIEKKLVEGGYGVLRGFSLGGSAPLDPPKYGPVTPQDGLVMPPHMGITCGPLKKTFHDFCIRAVKLAANHEKQVFTFLVFYPLILAFQALSCLANDRS